MCGGDDVPALGGGLTGWFRRIRGADRVSTRRLVLGMSVVFIVTGLLSPAGPGAQAEKADRDVREEAEAALDDRDDFVGSGSTVGLAKVRTRFADSTLILRYGLLNDLEADIRVPFVYAEREVDFGVTRERREDAGLGDVSGALRYQIWHERAGSPDVVLSLDVKSRTGDEPLLGSGDWNVGGSIALVKTFDPVVLFGRVGYTATLEREGRDPGDALVHPLGRLMLRCVSSSEPRPPYFAGPCDGRRRSCSLDGRGWSDGARRYRSTDGAVEGVR